MSWGYAGQPPRPARHSCRRAASSPCGVRRLRGSDERGRTARAPPRQRHPRPCVAARQRIRVRFLTRLCPAGSIARRGSPPTRGRRHGRWDGVVRPALCLCLPRGLPAFVPSPLTRCIAHLLSTRPATEVACRAMAEGESARRVRCRDSPAEAPRCLRTVTADTLVAAAQAKLREREEQRRAKLEMQVSQRTRL